MGGSPFMFAAKGTNLQEVFQAARDQAAWEHGHGGYTGTIAEKTGVELRRDGFVFPTVNEAEQFANDDIDNNKKWGDAFAVSYGRDDKVEGFVLYGWASS